jgi:hypothetical protein
MASSTLNVAIDDSTTQLILTSAADFPQVGSYYVMVEAEVMHVLNVSGNTMTVVRGRKGTKAVAHAVGTAVNFVVIIGGGV